MWTGISSVLCPSIPKLMATFTRMRTMREITKPPYYDTNGIRSMGYYDGKLI